MTLKILAAALCMSGVAWIASPVPASAAGPAMPHAQKAGEASPFEEVRHRRGRHKHCYWHRHRHWVNGHRNWKWHRHCRWYRGRIVIIL